MTIPVILSGVAGAYHVYPDAETLKAQLGPAYGSFGDGSDGDVELTAPTTLTKDMFYNSLIIDPGVVLSPAGFRIFCRGVLVNLGTIQTLGNDAVADAQGAALSAGAYGGVSGAGGAGGTGVGAAGATFTGTLGGAGGHGGAATSGGTAGGAGAGSTLAASAVYPRFDPFAVSGHDNSGTAYKGGAGGGAGGGDGANLSGAGGGGGGVMYIAARAVENHGVISVAGGKGGDASATGTSGGGGGGGGGVCVIRAVQYAGPDPVVAGGAGGAKTGTGAVGLAGAAGFLAKLVG